MDHCKVNRVTDKQYPIINITSLEEYVYVIRRLQDLRVSEIDEDGYFFYRGQVNCNSRLLPSLYRNINKKEKEKYYWERFYADRYTELKGMSNFERLAIMQHYGVPTKLLDITQNPLVALYFACEDILNDPNFSEKKITKPTKENCNGMDSDVNDYNNSGKFNPIKSASLYDIRSENSDDKHSKSESDDSSEYNLCGEVFVFYENSYNPDYKSFEEFSPPQESPSKNQEIEYYFVRPFRIDDRIERQNSSFIFFVKEVKHFKDEMIKKNRIRLIIEPECKGEILFQLNNFGVSEDTIFPDKEHLGRKLARYSRLPNKLNNEFITSEKVREIEGKFRNNFPKNSD